MEALTDSRKTLMMKLSPNVRKAWNHRESGMRLKARIIFDYELLYLEKGRLTVRIDDTIHTIVPGDIVLFKPGKEHEFIESNGECWMPHIHFDAFMRMISRRFPLTTKICPSAVRKKKDGFVRMYWNRSFKYRMLFGSKITGKF